MNSYSIEDIHYGQGQQKGKIFATLWDDHGLEYTATLEQICQKLKEEMETRAWEKRIDW